MYNLDNKFVFACFYLFMTKKTNLRFFFPKNLFKSKKKKILGDITCVEVKGFLYKKRIKK